MLLTIKYTINKIDYKIFSMACIEMSHSYNAKMIKISFLNRFLTLLMISTTSGTSTMVVIFQKNNSIMLKEFLFNGKCYRRDIVPGLVAMLMELSERAIHLGSSRALY